jgi:ATP-dependent helicase HrpA
MNAQLPIHAYRDTIVSLVRDNQVIIVVGPTGCGKTTVVPRMLLEAGLCKRGIIGVTEPRRIAAISNATYVAGQLGGEVGGVVGYRIRHQNRVDPNATKIAYMTEGMLLREMLSDPILRRYDVAVLDEVHERNVFQDLLMALVKGLLPKRPDLTVVVMSATINEKRFAEYFDAPIVHVEGRMFPVTVTYAPAAADEHVEASVRAVRKLLTQTPGDILVFEPDYASIRDVIAELGNPKGIDVLPLYGNQSPEEQMAVFNRERRSVIVATNIAETSVTLDGVTAVVDTGLIKEMRFYPKTATSSLQVAGHSKAGCIQRTGRAGRVAPGTCVRLYAEEDFRRRHEFTTPEILRTNLNSALLQMRAMGFTEAQIRGFEFMNPPRREFWASAKATLATLGALDPAGELTDKGRMMAQIPLSPDVTAMVLAAQKYRCVRQVITIAASFTTRPVFLRPIGREEEADDAHWQFRNEDSDFLTLLNAVERWRKADDRNGFAERNFLHPAALEEIMQAEVQIAAILAENGIECTSSGDNDGIKCAVASGLLANLLEHDPAHEGGRTYKSRRCDNIFLHRGSVVFQRENPPKFVVAKDIVDTSKRFARQVQVVPARLLKELYGIDTRAHRARARKRFRNTRHGRHH